MSFTQGICDVNFPCQSLVCSTIYLLILIFVARHFSLFSSPAEENKYTLLYVETNNISNHHYRIHFKMQFKTLAIALFAAAATAESIQELISQIPSCAKPCLDNASTKIGCSTTDNKCQCNKIDDLTQEAITCVSTSCNSDDLTKATKLSGEICAAVAADAGGAAASSLISSASAAATSAIGSAVTGSATDAASAPTETPGAGNRAAAGLGFAVAMAALAL
ncbi:hypothetical protein F4811DRAFT_499128 [Daldinia bambusicola]|nr:hypothetical protein F4811DRAFT_499128 [Daldinia bambusicola]